MIHCEECCPISSLQDILIRVPAVLICLTFHELAHGYVAYKLGDDTAKRQGRLTLNPVAHLDPIGTICLIIASFGWAKPVPINPSQFKMRNKKVGVALTALAGPAVNILLAFVALFGFSLALIYGGGNRLAAAFATFLQQFIFINIGLAVFNLLPIPPLDGSKVLMPFMPDRVLGFVYRYEGYIRFFFLVAVFLNLFNGVILRGIQFVFTHLLQAVGFLLGLAGVL